MVLYLLRTVGIKSTVTTKYIHPVSTLMPRHETKLGAYLTSLSMFQYGDPATVST